MSAFNAKGNQVNIPEPVYRKSSSGNTKDPGDVIEGAPDTSEIDVLCK